MNKAIAVSILFSVALAGCNARQGPSLSETLLWMDQTYNPHPGGANAGLGHGNQSVYSVQKLESSFAETFTHKGCELTIYRQTEPVGVWHSMPSSESETFNLRDIDPQSIKVYRIDSHYGFADCASPQDVKLYNLSCDEGEVIFSTRNNSPVIAEHGSTIFEELQGADHVAKRQSTESQAAFISDDGQYAMRFTKAFKHAVELCGGRPSPF